MANVTRYDPFDDLFKGFFVRPMDFPGMQYDAPSIKMDVKDESDAYLIHAELPGVKKEDIHVVVEGNILSINAEVKAMKEDKEGERVLRSERYFGKVSRSLSLDHAVDESKAIAKFNDGVLELNLPKREDSRSRRLTIK